MSSNIMPSNINGEYPIAGIENDSQGFRDNFTNTSVNFTATKAEIEDLQTKVLLKVPLLGETEVNNDYAGTEVRAAQIVDFRETIKKHELISGLITFDHGVGHYHTVQTLESLTFAFAGFSSETLCRIRIEVDVLDITHTITLPDSITIGLNLIKGFNAIDSTITFSSTGKYIYEFTSHDEGANITIEDLTSFPKFPFRTVATSKGIIGDTIGSTYTDGNYIYYCHTVYTDGSVDIWSRATLDVTPW